MTKISIYNKDTDVRGNDKWIGSDAQNQNRTKNFTPDNVAVYFNENQVIDLGVELRYFYDTLDPLQERVYGSITFETEIGPQVNFSAISTFILSKYTMGHTDVSQFLDFLVGSNVILSRSNNINMFGYYKIDNIEPYLPDPNFFVVTLTFETGNGYMKEDEDYFISLVQFEQEVPDIPTKTSDLINDGEDGVHPFITADDVPTPTLQSVTDQGDTTTTTVYLDGGALSDSINEQASFQPHLISTVNKNTGSGVELGSTGYVGISPDGIVGGYFAAEYVTEDVTLQVPNKPTGTYFIATVEDLPTKTSDLTNDGEDGINPFITAADIPLSGIPHATASGTDTYTATITGITSYADGDAFLIRFTNGNTTGCTLNINGLGAVPLYKNNDGPLIGGDIWAGGEMLCIYNSSLNIFQCIGTSPNSLFSYVTNADTVPITKGMPVCAFGGQGDRLTVKRAYNTSDATSAQTVGVVLSTSVGVNQKGIIIMQGLLDGLSILPTSTWADGDPIYLASTAGDITKTKQYAPNHLVYLGFVTTASNGSAGRWYVRIQNGFELDELHNVQAQSPTLKDTLWYDNTVSPAQWKTASIPTILGYTPAKLTQLGSQTLSSASWSLVGGYYTYTFSNVNITATSVVDFTPDNASVNEVSSCRMLPQVDVASGSCTFYATFPPQSNIIGQINIWQ